MKHEGIALHRTGGVRDFADVGTSTFNSAGVLGNGGAETAMDATEYLMSCPETMADIRKSRQEAKQGKVHKFTDHL